MKSQSNKSEKMKKFAYLALIFVLFDVSTQDITQTKGCDCKMCQGVDNQIQSLLSKKHFKESSCNLCEKREEMLRKQRERQQKLQKCPFELLGLPAFNGKTSEEIFDEFRELIAPSQNSFFDMMRGIVKTMHISSVVELNWAKEKEAKELALRKLEEAKKKTETKKEDILNFEKPEAAKVALVLDQKPWEPLIMLNQKDLLSKRFSKEIEIEPRQKEIISDLQSIKTLSNDYGFNHVDDLDAYLENEDLMQQLFNHKSWSTINFKETETDDLQQNKQIKLPEIQTESSQKMQTKFSQEFQTDKRLRSQTKPPNYFSNGGEKFPSQTFDLTSTESSFVKFQSNVEYKNQMKNGNAPNVDLLPKI